MAEFNERSSGEFEIHPEFESLYTENSLLRGELAALHEEFEHINRIVIPSTQTNYLIKVGALRVELLQMQVAVMRIRRKIALLRVGLERGEPVHIEALNYRVEREFKEWDDRLQGEVNQIEEAKARFSSLSEPEDADEIRSIYRLLSRKMNPEINPDQGEEAKSFWASIHSAYIWNDLFHLKALLMMADDYPDSYDLPTDIGGVRRNRDMLKEKIQTMLRKIDNLKQHPVFEWRKLLENPERLEQEQTKLRNEINRVRVQKVALQDMLTSLELRSVRR